MIVINDNGELLCSYYYCDFCSNGLCRGKLTQCPNISKRAKTCLPKAIKDYETLKSHPYNGDDGSLDDWHHELTSLKEEIEMCQALAKEEPPTENPVQPYSNQRAVQNTFEFFTKIVGVTFQNRQKYVKQCYTGQKLDLIRDKFNPYDKNAIAVYAGSHQVGFLSKELAAKLAPQMDKGEVYACCVETLTGGQEDTNYGLNVKISGENSQSASPSIRGHYPMEICKNFDEDSYDPEDDYIPLEEYYGSSDWEEWAD